MDDVLDEWVGRLEAIEAPAFRHNVAALAALAADENAPMARIAAVVERDPGLTIRLLRRVNGLRHRHLRSEVTTVRHALMMLGLGPLRALPDGLPMLESLDPAVATRLRSLYSRAFHAAAQAREMARLQKEQEPDETFTATLLRGLAEILLWMQAPNRMEQLQRLAHDDANAAEEPEYVAFGFGLDQLTARLAAAWGLPSLLVQSLHGENATQGRVLHILLAHRLAHSVERGWYTARTSAVIEQIAESLVTSFEAAAIQLHRVAVDAARATEFYGVVPAAVGLLLPSAPEAEPGRQEGPAAALEADDGTFCLAPQPPVFDRVMRRLAQPERTTLHQLLELSLTGLHEGLGLNRVAFALLTPEKTRLQARATLGAEGDPQFNRFSVDLESGELFARLMERPQALWLDYKNRDRFLPLVPAPFLKLVGVEQFYLTSVFVKGHPVGIFYADRHSAACALDARAYHRFKQLATQAGKAMESISNR